MQVFRRCKAQWITGMHRPIYSGIPAQEIESAARLMRVPETEYQDLLDGIAVMVAETSEIRNQ